jgi:hypothetical protein
MEKVMTDLPKKYVVRYEVGPYAKQLDIVEIRQSEFQKMKEKLEKEGIRILKELGAPKMLDE